MLTKREEVTFRVRARRRSREARGFWEQNRTAEPEPTVSEANTEPPLLHAEVGGEGQLHHVPRGVERQPAGRRPAEPDVGVSRVDQNPVVDAARRLLQVEVKEGELDDEAGGGLHGPLAGLQIGVFLWVAGRRELPLGLRQLHVTAAGAAAQRWRRATQFVNFHKRTTSTRTQRLGDITQKTTC